MGGMLKSLISISFLLFLIGSSQSLRAQDQEAKVEISSKPNQVSAGDQRKFDYFFYEGLNLKAAGKFDVYMHRKTLVVCAECNAKIQSCDK